MRKLLTSRRSTVALHICAVLTIAACATEPDEATTSSSSAPVADNAVFWSSIWSADPGIDMFSRTGELVRGSVEAGYLAQAYGVDQSFPGYSEALGDNRTGDPLENEPINWASAPPGRQPTPARSQQALFYHLAELDHDETTVNAIVCSYALGPTPSDAHKFLYNGIAVTLTRTAGDEGQPGVADNGASSPAATSRKIPEWNIFEPWQINQSHMMEVETIPASCVTWWKSVFPDAVQDPGRNSVQLPGPAPAAYDVDQYPEWIGPANAE